MSKVIVHKRAAKYLQKLPQDRKTQVKNALKTLGSVDVSVFCHFDELARRNPDGFSFAKVCYGGFLAHSSLEMTGFVLV